MQKTWAHEVAHYFTFNRRFCWRGSAMTVSSGDLGAAYELSVAADLIKRGFDVFRNLSPNGKADLLARKGNRTFTVQVKSKYVVGCGCDIFAAFNDGAITYYVREGTGTELFLRQAVVYLIRKERPLLKLVDWNPTGYVEAVYPFKRADVEAFIERSTVPAKVARA
jgi:hypothetical protein